MVEFLEERIGWSGYIEWEKHDERKEMARKVLRENPPAGLPEFSRLPLPSTSPVFSGAHWKSAHAALGLQHIVDASWAVVQREKPDLVHLLDFPYSGQTRPEKLVAAGKITPNGQHFVRNHGGVPLIDEEAYELEIGGLVNQPVKLSLGDIKNSHRFPQVEVTVTMQCSGNRRTDQLGVNYGDGSELPWGHTAIGTARYRGVPLKSIIESACYGVQASACHAEFVGADTIMKQGQVANYAVSIPLRKLRIEEEVILAWEMNGEPLPLIHGFPLRVVVAGYIGARSCKWLTRINILDEPSMGWTQRKQYLYYPPQVGKHNATYTNGFSIQAMPVSSAILSLSDRQVVVHSGHVELQGWAYSGNGNWIERVEVSPDGGRVWYPVEQDDMSEKHYYAWRLWKIALPLDAEGWVELSVRAWDSSCNTQPTETLAAWNWAMHVTSSAQRLTIYSVNASREATRRRLEQMQQAGVGLEPISRPLPFPLEDENQYRAFVKNRPREPAE